MISPKRSLRTQLLASHLVLGLLMAAITGSAIYSLRGIEASFNRERNENGRALRGAEIVNAALVEQRTALWLLFAGAKTQSQATYRGSWRDFQVGLDLARTPGLDNRVATSAEWLSRKAADYKSLSDKVMANPRLGPGKGSSRVISALESKLGQLRLLAVGLQDQARLSSNRDAESAREASDATIAKAGWVTLICLFVAIGLSFRLVRYVVAPLSNLVERAGKIAEGDLTPRPIMSRRDEIGTLSNAIEVMTDRIREARNLARRRLQRAEQMSDAALEHLYDPVVVLDPKGRIVHLNQAAEELLGKIPDDVKVPIKEHIKDRRLAKALQTASATQSISASEDEASSVVLIVQGVRKVYRLRATPMKDEEGVPLGSVAVLEDVTHFRELDRLKNEFIGVASHELRTPVSSLLLSAQLLKDGAVGDLTEGQKEIIEIQLQDLERLEKLMKDLLDVTKLAAGMTPLHLESVSAEELVSACINLMQAQAAKNQVRLGPGDELPKLRVKVDRSQIGRVLVNLVANAVRHTKAGGSVTVGARAKDNEVTFYVEDTGEGIPPDYLARIFDRFVQVPGATQGGAGLGLSIAQNIVKAHHGFMGVESQVGTGSVFSFTLPLDFPNTGEELTA